MLAAKSRNWQRGTSPLALALTVSLCAQFLVGAPVQALSFISSTKKSQLQTPMEAKLDLSDISTDTASGAGEGGDKASTEAKSESKSDTKTESKADAKTEAKADSKKEAKADSKKDSKKVAAKSSKESKSDESVNLAPLSLTDDKATKSEETASESGSESAGGSQYMKLHAETMGIAPKGPLDGDGDGPPTLPSKSLKSEIGPGKGKLVDQAKTVNVMPMSLMDSDAESQDKVITDLDCERAQISELWEATLSRNQDIQFVVQKLMPSSDKNHTTTALMRMISSTLATGVSAAAMMSPSPTAYMGAQMGSSMIYQLMGLQEQKTQKRAQIDQGQAINLYKMVRDTADKVTETYRDYKKYMRRVDRAERNTTDLQNMIQEARAGQDAAKQIEMQYWVSKSKGDVEEANSDARRYRQSLIDLAGVDAVNKLDQSLQDQLLAEQELEKKNVAEAKAPKELSKNEIKTREVLNKLVDVVQPAQAAGGKQSPNM